MLCLLNPSLRQSHLPMPTLPCIFHRKSSKNLRHRSASTDGHDLPKLPPAPVPALPPLQLDISDGRQHNQYSKGDGSTLHVQTNGTSVPRSHSAPLNDSPVGGLTKSFMVVARGPLVAKEMRIWLMPSVIRL